MPGPAPKDPSVRARRNKSSTRAVLASDPDIEAPPLPEGIGWHSLTVRWWESLWESEMAPQYIDMDVHGLYRVAMLYNDYWLAESPKERAEIQVRLEKADADYGTNPMARRRLEWQIEQSEDAKSKGQKRRAFEQPAVQPDYRDDDDPRLTLVQ